MFIPDCIAGSLAIDESSVNRIVIKSHGLLTCYEDNYHPTRFFWGYNELVDNDFVISELVRKNEIENFCRMLSELHENTDKPVYTTSTYRAAKDVTAKKCLVPFLLNHLEEYKRYNYMIDGIDVFSKIEIYSCNNTKISLIWCDRGCLDYKKKRYIMSEEMIDYITNLYLK